MFKTSIVRLGVSLLALAGTLPITAGVASAEATTSRCVNGRVTVDIPNRSRESYPCDSTRSQLQDGRGFIEICKDTQPVTRGTFFSFSIPGRDGLVSVPSGACSPPIAVPSGTLTITESARDRYELCGVSTEPSGRFVDANLPARKGTVTVPTGDISTQTIVFFRNCETGRLKLCKVAGAAIPIGKPFAMTVTPENPAGPSTSFSVPAGPKPEGYCILSGIFRVGTQVRVTDDLSRFFLFQNTAHSVRPANREVPNSFQPENNGAITPATAHVVIGSGVTEVSFTNSCTFPGAPNCGGGFTSG